MINRQLSMEDFLDESRMRDPRVGEFARKVKVVVDNDPQIEYSAKLPVTVEIISETRGKFIRRAERIHGDPNDPLTPEEFRQKVISCAKYSVNADVSKRVDDIIETTNHLEDVNDIRTLISLLT
jgi:2-methylcitrate dehydratase PrpD